MTTLYEKTEALAPPTDTLPPPAVAAAPAPVQEPTP